MEYDLNLAVIDWVVWTIIFVVTTILSAALTILMAPSGNSDNNEPDPSTLDDFQIPTASEDRVVPILYGTRLVKAPNLVWYGDLRDKKIKKKAGSGKASKKQTVGFMYFLRMMWIIAQGEIQYLDWRMNGVVQNTFNPPIPPGGGSNIGFEEIVTGKEAPQNGSGRSTSNVVFSNGSHTEAQFTQEFQDRLNTAYFQKTFAYIWMDDSFIGDNVSSVPRYSCVCRRVNFTSALPFGSINNGNDANPAHVIYDLLVNELLIPASLIETAGGDLEGSFEKASVTLNSENLGVSFLMNQARTAQSWISDVLRHIDAFLFFNSATGKWNLKLVRDDYDIATLPVLTNRLYADLKLSRRAWEDTFTDIELKWTSTARWQERTQTIVNNASRLNLGYKKKKLVSFPMFTNRDGFGNIIARLKKRYFFPSISGNFKISLKKYREEFGKELNPGDVIVLDVPSLDATGFVMRVMGVGGSTSSDQRSSVEVTEDIFGLGSVEIEEVPDGDFVPVNYELDNAPEDAVVKNALAEMTDPAEDDISPQAMIACTPPIPTDPLNPPVLTGYNVTINDEDGVEARRDFDGSCEVLLDLVDTKFMDRVGGFLAVDVRVVNQPVTISRAALQQMTILAVVDHGGDDVEVMSIASVADLGSGVFLFSDVIRGLGGTPIIDPILPGTKVWFPFEGILGTAPLQMFQSSAVLNFRAANTFQISPKLDRTFTNNDRARTPYPPFNLRAERVGPDVELTWWGRSRRRGATHIDPDQIPVIDEPWEGQLEITASDGFGPVYVDPNFLRGVDGFITKDTYTRLAAPGGAHTYTLRTLLNGRFSEPVVIAVI